MKKTYYDYDHKHGYPVGDNLYYECMACGDIIPSLPQRSRGCRCDNVFIDVGYARVCIKDHDQVKLFATEAVDEE